MVKIGGSNIKIDFLVLGEKGASNVYSKLWPGQKRKGANHSVIKIRLEALTVRIIP